MQSTAIHTRLFAVVYGTAQRSNITKSDNVKNKVLALLILFCIFASNNYIMAKDRTEYLKEYHKRTYVPTGNKQGRPTELPQYDFAGIYQLRCTVNGKIYIGQAQNILSRFNEHRRNRNGLLIYRDCILYRAIKKYGWGKFEISVLEKVDDFELLNEREIFWINKLNPEYNTKGGGNCARGWKHTEESKRKMSETTKGMYKGEKNPFYGKSHSEETKKKIRESKLGKKLSKEHREKLKNIDRSSLQKQVSQYKLDGEFVNTFNSVKDAAKTMDVAQSTLSSHLIGRNKTCKGYIFKYV